jgi:HPt (histidine-containing phosphotransfer) domain-containing protein
VSKPIRKAELAAALARSESRTTSASGSTRAHEVEDLEAVDLTQLEATVEDPTFVRELISTFLSDAPHLVGALRNAIEEHNPEELRIAAHTLKSNGRTFGATALASLSEELELSAQTGMLEGAGELVTRIENEYTRVERALGALAGHRLT